MSAVAVLTGRRWSNGLPVVRVVVDEPLPARAVVAFTARGTCNSCGLVDVVCTHLMVCALCVMTGRV